jgi:serine/threonine protein kinase/tetratricopeptide (TPR) repeat protein
MVSRDIPDETGPDDTDAMFPARPAHRSWSNDPLIGHRLGEYQIRRVLGRGGMGSVYEALHLHLHKPVAVKVLAPHLLDDPRAIERFRREMRAIGRLNSAYIVQALDASLTGEIHFLVMEFIDGLDADELVRRLHGIPVEDACEIVRQAALGLADAHRHELVHRDIKPKNLAVSSRGQVKILDFGLALCKSEILSTGQLTAQAAIGSYQYMAPEQFDDSHDVDIRADLYSLGCSFYHLLVGTPPFSGEKYRSLSSLMDAHRLHTPPPAHEFNGLVGPDLSAIINRLLSKQPEERIQTPDELASLLEPHAERSNLPAIVSMASASFAHPSIGTQPPKGSGGDRSTPEMAPTAVTQVNSSNRRPMSNWSHSSARRRRGWFWLAGSLGIFLTILASLSYWGYRARLEAAATRMRAERKDIALFVGNMPGLNGNWWLDETPWMLPSIRAELYDWMISSDDLHPGQSLSISVDEKDVALLRKLRKEEDTVSLSSHVRELAKQLAVYLPSGERNAFFSLEGDDPDTFDDTKIRSKFENIAQWHEPDPNQSSAIELHVQAVARHKQGRWSEAEELYRQAIDRFGKMAGEEMDPKRVDRARPSTARNEVDLGWFTIASLAMSDYGELLYVMGRFDDAALQFRLASETSGSTPREHAEFIIYNRGRESDSLRKSVDGRPQAHEALRLAAESAKNIPADHPMVAFLHERQSWLALDEWQADAAVRSFKLALSIRQQSADAGNKRASFFVYLDEQGLAMAERTQGSFSNSQKRLEDLARSVERARTEPKRLSPKQRSELEGRYLRTLEHQSDIPLFDLGEPAKACGPLELALEFAQQESLNEGKLSKNIDRIRFKLAIGLAMQGRDREASQTLEQASKTTRLGMDLLYQELAQQAVAMAKKEPQASEGLAKIILSIDADRADRDEIELAFLAARLFYPSIGMATDLGPKVLRRHARLVETIGRTAEDRSLLAYLRPHYDAMMETAVKLGSFPAAEIGHLALESRTPRSSSVEKDTLILYFGADRGWVIDVDSEGSAVVFDAPFGAGSIVEARHDPQQQAELARLIPEPVRQRAKSLSPERILIVDSVRGLISQDADFLMDH